jgi:CHAT domain-containing protein/tetratricopeptide (TPR) repeat protein
MPDNQAVDRCVNAFINRDYTACTESARRLLQAGQAPHHVLQLLLISLQRLGKEEQARELGEQFLRETTDPWRRSLLQLTLGQLRPGQARSQAKTNVQLCQYGFYLAASLLTPAETGRLRDLTDLSLLHQTVRNGLAECLQLNADCVESRLAAAVLTAGQETPPSQTTTPPAATDGGPDRIPDARVYEQLHQAYRNGDAVACARLAVSQLPGRLSPEWGGLLFNSIVLLKETDFQRLTLTELTSLADFVGNVGYIRYRDGKYAQAEPLLQRALDLRRAALGERHPDIAQSLISLAAVRYKKGDYQASEPLTREALEILRSALGEAHPQLAVGLSSLGELYRAMGRYGEAEPFLRQALEIRRVALGPTHPDCADTLNDLGELRRALGDLEEAANLHREAPEVRRAARGDQHPSVGFSLNNLAETYRAQGNYSAAEPLYRQSLDICRSTQGEKHPEFATCLLNLAGLHQAMGNYEAAKPLARQALEVRRAALGDGHPAVATALNNLGVLYHITGDHGAAGPLFQQALEICRGTLGEDHSQFAQSLNNLAEVCFAEGNYTAAEPLLRQALAIWRAAYGDGHPDVARSLGNLAMLHHATGNAADAEPLFRQALDITRTVLGEVHPDVAGALHNLAWLYIATDRAGAALALMQQAARIGDQLIGQVFSIGSESQRAAFLKETQGNLGLFLSLVCGHLAHAPEGVRAALELVLRRKAIGAEVQAAQRDAVLGGKYPHLQPQLQQWSTLRRQIARKTLAGPGPEGSQAHQQQLAQWHEQRERLEAELAHQITEMNLEQKLRAADRRAVALALPPGVALVEFVRFDVFDFKAVPARGERQCQPARYLAFILPSGNPDDVKLIDLGEADEIDQMIELFRAGVAQPPDERSDRNMVKRRSDAAPGTTEDVGRRLRAAVIDKLASALGGQRRLLLSPDGGLARLPFAVLPAEDGRLLMDEYQISYVNTGRDVLRFGVASSGQPAAPLVVADPDFDLRGSDAIALEQRPGLPEPSRPSRHSRDLNRSQYHFHRLPGTRAEGARIASLLGVEAWQEAAALEGRLKHHCRSPRILHLATHGFFLQDQKRDPNQEQRDIGVIGAEGRLSGPLPENPLLRSGLALAGANTWLQGGTPPEDAEDGLLTAEDVSGLDLLATELVVLSACDTGLGEVRTGEGVFGLQRAFTLAGAKTLVMSLWSVPDQQTRELMEDFYQRILNGQPRADALRDAQLALRRKYPDPFFWGAFICQGNPGPLPA